MMHLSTRQSILLLALVISARATSFLFSKLCLTSMNSFSLLSLRFTTASILLFILFYKRILNSLTLHNLISGVIIGAIFFFVLAFEHTGLKTTNASTASFLENLAIIIVPFMECVISRKFPAKKTLFRGFLAMAGVGMLTMSESTFGLSVGELFLLGAAFSYAMAIITTSRLSKTGDSFVIGFVQVTTTGILSWFNVAISGSFTMPQQPSQYVMILLLAVVCTSFGFTLQPVSQRNLSAETAGSFCALGPLVASLFSCIFLKEPVTVSSFLGAFLILLSLIIKE